MIRFFIYLLPSGVLRTKWIERFDDNVAVATDVMFINHDVSQKVFNQMYEESIPKFFGCIEVGNNVFIGARVTILPNVKICDNVYIAAGALVSKSICESGIWGCQPDALVV